MSGWPKLEYMSSGYVGRVGAARPTPSFQKALPAPNCFMGGWATRYMRAHVHRSRIEVMGKGCFAPTLAAQQVVRFLIDHDEAQLVATSADGLKLRSDEVGLAFVLSVPETEMGAKAYQAVQRGDLVGMSVGYEVLEVEEKVLDGDPYYLVRSARLNEISLVSRGAVSQAYAKVIDRPDFSLVQDSAAGADRAADETRNAALHNRGKAAASALSESFRELARLLNSFERSTSAST